MSELPIDDDEARAAAQRLKRNEALQELGEMAEQGDFDALLNKAHYRR